MPFWQGYRGQFLPPFRLKENNMGKSLIQVTNQSNQTVANNSIIGLGSTQRRYGCNLRLSGNGIEVTGEGYYKVDASVSVAPTSAGAVTVAIYDDGIQIPGAIAYTTGTAGDPVSVSINTTIRQSCCCDNADNLTLVLIAGAGTVQNVSLRVEKS